MRKRILITGRVHDVGFRPFLLGIAESLELEKFFAENVFSDGKQAVEVLIEASDEKVKAFIEMVKGKKPENAEVERVEVEDYDGNIMKTESYYRYLTAMQLAKMISYGGKMLGNQDKMLGNQGKMLEKQDKMLEKQDKTINVIKEESEKTREVIGGKIDLLRTDLKDYIRVNLENIRKDIFEIKKVLKEAGMM